MRSLLKPVLWWLIAPLLIAPARADKRVFHTPKLGTNLGVWRLTADPTVRHHANYHNTQCWSPDGRYICYTRYGGPNAGSEATATVHLYDTHDDSTQQIGQGESPRWAKRKNWLFYEIDPLSIICFPKAVGDASGIYDADPKGSPDGTKICFVSNYDLEQGPVTRIAADLRRDADRLVVESTAGFSASGAICVQREVIGYRRTTPTAFEGLTRGLHDTAQAALGVGRTITSFEARCLTEAQWQQIGGASSPMRKTIGDAGSPLLRQRQTDVYLAVVRKPDCPWLRGVGDAIELIPGEHHAETRGYRLLKAGRPYADRLIQPGMSVALDDPGEYQAVAVEWSGMESDPGNTVPTERRGTLRVLADQPADFAWLTDRWTDASQAIKETVHRYEGVIRREFYSSGTLVKAHDLNEAGQAIRRVSYRDGQIAEREYDTSAGVRVSREILAPGGHVAETLYYARDGQTESAHWWFDRGLPVKLVRGGKTYVTRGDRFGRIDGDHFVDTRRGPYSE